MFFKSKSQPAPVVTAVPPPVANGFMSSPVPSRSSSQSDAAKSLATISLLGAQPTAAPSAPKPMPPMGSTAAAIPMAAPNPGLVQKWAKDEANVAVTFLRIIKVLASSPQHKKYALTDIEALVYPAVVSGQCAVLQSNPTDKAPAAPIAVALWANVSPEVERRLKANIAAPYALSSSDWRSGDIPWLVEAVGPPHIVQHLLTQLQSSTFKGRELRMRTMDANGKLTVGMFKPAR